MMLAVMPMAGAGFFGMNLGMVAPIMTLVLHVIYGAVLGGVYAALQSRKHGHQNAHWRAKKFGAASVSAQLRKLDR